MNRDDKHDTMCADAQPEPLPEREVRRHLSTLYPLDSAPDEFVALAAAWASRRRCFDNG